MELLSRQVNLQKLMCRLIGSRINYMAFGSEMLADAKFHVLDSAMMRYLASEVVKALACKAARCFHNPA